MDQGHETKLMRARIHAEQQQMVGVLDRELSILPQRIEELGASVEFSSAEDALHVTIGNMPSFFYTQRGEAMSTTQLHFDPDGDRLVGLTVEHVSARAFGSANASLGDLLSALVRYGGKYVLEPRQDRNATRRLAADLRELVPA